MRSVRITISNEFSVPKTLWLEPWGEDYRIAPGDEFEIIARNVDDEFFFAVTLHEDYSVYAEGQVTDIGVYKRGELIQCGYNRETEPG
jgi:hypothetical protein